MSEAGNSTATLGMVLGGVLGVVGIAAYVISGFASLTALIPTLFGVLIAGLGAVGRSDERQRIAIYGIGILAALGVLGSLRGVPDIIALLSGSSVDSVVATVSQGLMIVFSVVLVVSVVRYVLDSR